MEAGLPPDGREPFDVSPDPETTAPRAEFEGANVCRAAALSPMLAGRYSAVRGLDAELSDLGFAPLLREQRQPWGERDPTDMFLGLRDLGELEGFLRVDVWQRLQETSEPRDAVAFLTAVLSSLLERESAAAAAALWPLVWRIQRELGGDTRGFWFWERWGGRDARRLLPPWAYVSLFPQPGDGPDIDDEDTEPLFWDGDRWANAAADAARRFADPNDSAFFLSLLVRLRLALALRSADDVTRSLARAAFAPPPDVPTVQPPRQGTGPIPSPALPTVSTMIHGTAAWKGDWWRPEGLFHRFVLKNHRPNLYRGGARFSWSGALRRSHRERAYRDFCDWAADRAPDGLQTVFAHSYGGEIACLAALAGTAPHELVLLSVPVTPWVDAATESGIRMIDVRLKLDPVLMLTGWPQRLLDRSSVIKVPFTHWRLSHSASHDPHTWAKEDVAERAKL